LAHWIKLFFSEKAEAKISEGNFWDEPYRKEKEKNPMENRRWQFLSDGEQIARKNSAFVTTFK